MQKDLKSVTEITALVKNKQVKELKDHAVITFLHL